MFYDDVRALRQIYANALEDSSSEVSPAVLLEISTLCLRCASRWLAAEQAYVWANARDLWTKHGYFLNVFQNILSGGTYFTVEDRLEALDKASEDVYQTLYHIEELLVEIVKFQAEESTRRSLASLRTNAAFSATPMRRIESAAGGLIKATKNWLALVYHAREAVWKALDFDEDRETLDLIMRRSTFTQNAPTRAFVGIVLKQIARTRPGSSADVRGPNWRLLLPFTRTPKQQKLLENAREYGTVVSKSGLIGAFSNSVAGLHFPFWDNAVAKALRNTAIVCGGVLSLLLFHRSNPDRIPTAIESTQAWFKVHLYEPFQAMLDELFFNRPPKQQTKAAAAEAQSSLDRMLEEYRRDRHMDTSSFSISNVSEAFEKAIKHPIKEALTGDLIRLGLIQAQALKTETLNLATEMDEIMAENHFNSQILATLPAIGVLGLVFNLSLRVYRWSRDESNNRVTAQIELRLALWDIETLLIREDDGPSLFSFLSEDDRGSEGGGSEHWVQNPVTIGQEMAAVNFDAIVRRSSLGGDGSEKESGESDDRLDFHHFPDESLQIDPVTRFRRQLAGQMICTAHHLFNLLLRSRAVLFRGRDRDWANAVRDVNCLFAREGWTARARLELARTLTAQILAL